MFFVRHIRISRGKHSFPHVCSCGCPVMFVKLSRRYTYEKAYASIIKVHHEI